MIFGQNMEISQLATSQLRIGKAPSSSRRLFHFILPTILINISVGNTRHTALENVSVEIQGGTKVGIIGRTGRSVTSSGVK